MSILNSIAKFLADKPTKVDFKEYGATGTQMFSGFITDEEYVNNLVGQQGIDIYDRMRRSDAQVRGTLYAVTLPIRQAKWFVESASDDSKDIEIAEQIEQNLLYEMSITWDDFLRQALSYLTFGFSLFEPVYEYRNGLIAVKKLAPRIQKTLYEWKRDEDGDFGGIVQYTQKGDSSKSKFEYITIPAEKLLLFTNDMEGSNFEGISVLRSAYKHWYMKDSFYKIDALSHDRFASGIPWVKEPISPDAKDRAAVATILQNLHSRERSYLHVPYGWELGIFEKSGNNDSIIKSIEHHNEEIAKNILAQFISLGTSSTGSRALGESFEELFMMSLNTYADYISSVVTDHLIKKLCDYNYAGIKEYPRLKHSHIMLNVGKYLNAISTVGLTNVLTTDLETENHIREIIGLPEKEEVEEMPEDNTTPIQNKIDPQAELHEKSIELKEHKRCRELTDVEKKCADFDKIETSMNGGEERHKKQILKIRDQMARDIADQVVNKKADKVIVPYVGKLADRLFEENLKAFRNGKNDTKDEIEFQKKQVEKKAVMLEDESTKDEAAIAAALLLAKKKSPAKLDIEKIEDVEDPDAQYVAYMKDKATADSITIGNAVLSTALFALYNIDQTGKTKAQLADEIYTQTKDTGLTLVDSVSSASGNKAYGLGREAQSKQMGEIEYAIYSAVLDGGTCEVCAPKDGVKHELDDPEFQAPSPDCAGGSRCRCVNVYVTKGMDI